MARAHTLHSVQISLAVNTLGFYVFFVRLVHLWLSSAIESQVFVRRYPSLLVGTIYLTSMALRIMLCILRHVGYHAIDVNAFYELSVIFEVTKEKNVLNSL